MNKLLLFNLDTLETIVVKVPRKDITVKELKKILKNKGVRFEEVCDKHRKIIPDEEKLSTWYNTFLTGDFTGEDDDDF